MGLVSKPYTFSAGASIIASEHNSNFDTIYNSHNGNISNSNISNSAAIVYSKLSLAGSILNADIHASAAIAKSKLNLTGGIVNADVNASAAIVDTKLATISTAGKVSGASFTSLSSIPSGAGVIPAVNIGFSDKKFSAYKSSDQAGITNDKLTFDTEDFDTGSNFASSTFTAPITGKYIFTVGMRVKHSASGNSAFACRIYVNGSNFSTLCGTTTFEDSLEFATSGSIILSLTANDTVEVYGVQQSVSGSYTVVGGATVTRFTGALLQ